MNESSYRQNQGLFIYGYWITIDIGQPLIVYDNNKYIKNLQTAPISDSDSWHGLDIPLCECCECFYYGPSDNISQSHIPSKHLKLQNVKKNIPTTRNTLSDIIGRLIDGCGSGHNGQWCDSCHGRAQILQYVDKWVWQWP